ncbi:MAG: bifunctional adenosylcobinamide kinase/adenosylcobinamide-phosphate guanylyltransferase [SAR202 cluster bacterium]|nr:bifunctional adenosylcobinamide kinase/adenosylcobinamide-phosphate guanylyltransferase [SAR202 cluster bacterium]
MAGQVCLVLGGVRSGKSSFAEELALHTGQPAIYLATGVVSDAEMAERIRRHQARRPGHWRTLEEPLDLAGGLVSALTDPAAPSLALVDSLDVWVSNLLLKYESETDAFLERLAIAGLDMLFSVCHAQGASLTLVSCEVGLSLVPPYPLGRRFQDLLGLVNQRAAAQAGEVYLVVAGIAVDLKALAR